MTKYYSPTFRRADDGKGLEAHFSERRRREFKDFGFSCSVYILSKPLPNETYIYIRGRGLGRGSSKISLAGSGSFPPRADDGKGLEAHFSERRRREFLFGFSGSVFAK